MKSVCVFIFYFFCIFYSYAQSPHGINYQAIARDVSGNPIASQSIPVVFKIHRGSTSGPISCSETQNITTNTFGLFTWIIGSSNHPNFDTITWAKNSYFLEVLVNNVSMGSTQFISVPYAFHAHTADSVKNFPVSLSPWTKAGAKIFPISIGDSVGIGTALPGSKLEVSGKTKTTNLQITTGAAAGNILTSADAAGNAKWSPPPTNTLTGGAPNYLTKWATSSTLTTSVAYDNGKSIGIGTASIPADAILSIYNGHLKVSQSAAPTVTVTANAGNSATAVFTSGINANDIVGQINFTSGSGGMSPGDLVFITFNKPYSTTPIVMLTPMSIDACDAVSKREPIAMPTTTGFSINFSGTDNNKNYIWNYLVIEP